MPPAARIGDMHTCPMSDGPKPHVGGPVLLGQPTVVTGGMPQSRINDTCTCVGPPDMIAKGSAGVLVGGQPAARMGDITAHGGAIIVGCPTVIIGEIGGGGGGGGAGMVPTRMGTEGSGADQAAMAKVMTQASKDGTPFCEQCQKGA